MLAGQNSCGAEDSDLLTVHHCFERRPDRHFGFSVPHISTEKTVHRGLRFHILHDLFDGLQLVFCLIEFKSTLKFSLPGAAGAEVKSLYGFPLSIQLQELFRYPLDGLFCTRLRFFPG